MMKWIVLLLVLGVVFYLLYINGYLFLNSKRAVMFVGTNRGKKATFSSCSGYVKRVVKFEESREYHFEFTTELEKGSVRVELLDSNKKCILSLGGNENSDLLVKAGNRYYLVVRFESATGNYVLDWK